MGKRLGLRLWVIGWVESVGERVGGLRMEGWWIRVEGV